MPRYIISDRKKIQRVLLNLLGNSIKFTQKGYIAININCISDEGNQAHLQFSVADTGIGITKELQGKVFDRFFRVSPSYKGIYNGYGLGLSIAQSYVHLLGGNITLTSEEGRGTTFFFDIICKRATDDDITRDKKNVLSFQAKDREKIPHLLLIEDNLMALKVLETLVIKLGYTFKSATTGEEGLALAQSDAFDLIITDIGLPGMSGNDLAIKIRQWENDNNRMAQPIIGLTGHAKAVAYDECIASGMNDVFTKSGSSKLIEQLVNQYVLNTPLGVQKEKTKKKTEGLGLDLPNTEQELFELDDFPVFDIKYAMNQISDLSTLLVILKESISDVVQKDIQKMTLAYAQGDWEKIETIAHKIKSGAVYIGTRRLFYACQYLERYFKAGHRVMFTVDPIVKTAIRLI
ncbi:ATP-binding protein [Legionella antarctica]|uniref:ATP-binding protein n=1 Tax=Legionella antarctica TaxID=2708020 RepID=UPI001563682D|nr:ATP-binding protein [Legionella antarctica]